MDHRNFNASVKSASAFRQFEQSGPLASPRLQTRPGWILCVVMRAGSIVRLLKRWGACAFIVVIMPLAGRAQFGGGYMDDFDSQDYVWTVDPAFKGDVFTFARLKHESGGGFGYYSRRESWAEDAPRADVMLAFRVHQITSMNVRPGFNPIDFTKEELAKYPFVYFSGVESMALREPEVAALRNYLLSGGFMMVDNFWGDAAWHNFAHELKRVFPERTPVDLPIDHPLFHIVYDFKTKPQMPTAGVYERFGVFYDMRRDYGVMTHNPHYFAVFDDKGRMMMVICHNNHFGDGWEHEGDDPTYFHVISEGMAYPMFINIVVYAMTH